VIAPCRDEKDRRSRAADQKKPVQRFDAGEKSKMTGWINIAEAKRRVGAVDVHRVWMIVAAIEMKALKLWSVLQERMAIPLFSFNLPK